MTTTAPAPAEAAEAAPAGSGPAPADRRRWIALAVVLTASFMDLVDATIVNIAIPSIRQDTGASFSAVQWVTAGYALAFAVGLITGGRLGDIYGRKRLFLLGMAGFTLASALCGLAADPGMLVGARVLQGAMAALMVPQVLAIIHVSFPAHERGKVFGMFGAVIGLGAVCGPLIGALLTEGDLFGLAWRPIFLINLPVGLAGILLGGRFVTESRAPRALRLDLIGTALATLGLLLVLYPLTQGRESGWPLWGFAAMAASPVVLALFVRYERAKARKDGSPLVELSLFSVRSFAAGVGVQLTFGAVSGLFFLIWTLHMQLGLGWGPLHAGLTGVPFSLACSAAAGMSVQKLVPRFGRKVLQAGALIMLCGALVYLWEAAHYGTALESWQLVPAMLLMGGGMGLIVAPVTDVVLSEVPAEHSGSASGIFNTVGQLGMALGLGLSSVAFFAVVDRTGAGAAPGASFVPATTASLWWIAGGLLVVFGLLFLLPKGGPAGRTPASCRARGRVCRGRRARPRQVKSGPWPYRSRPPASHTDSVSMISNLRKAVRLPQPRTHGVDLSHPARSPLGTAVVNCAVYVDGVRQDGNHPADVAIRRVRRSGRGFVWIGLHEPSEAEFAGIVELFGLHPLAVEDAVYAHQRPKLEHYDDSLFTVFKTVRYVEHDRLTDTSEVVETGEIMVFTGSDFVITVRHGGHGSLGPLREQLESDPEQLALGPSAVLHAIADLVVDDYLDVAATVQVDIDDVESEVFSVRGGSGAGRIYQLKRELLELKHAVAPLDRPMQELATQPMRQVDPRIKTYFRDVADHLDRVTEQITAFDELLNSILQAHLAQVTVAQNEDMRRISAWVAILAIPTMVCGVYGMNFEHMPEKHWVFGYPLVMALILTACWVMHRGFKRNGWL